MSNGIAERQNKKTNIAKLAAQRQLYSDAGIITSCSFILTVIIPLTYTIIQEFAIDNASVRIVFCFFSLAMLFLSNFLKSVKKNKKILAASIQQEFDIDVYRMPWDKKLFGERKNYSSEIAESSKRILDNDSQNKQLYNWYDTIVDSLPLIEGIAACQKLNVNWDVRLRRRYKWLMFCILTVIVLVPIIICVVKKLDVQELLFRLFMISPALKWFTDMIVELDNDLKSMESLKRQVCSTEIKNMTTLQFTQKEIFENRKNAVKIPDWFYMKCKDKDEDRERRALENDL